VGGRHLRRLFAEQLGASPLAVAQTRRTHFAKRMIEETTLSMTQIAFATGYNSVRSFNAAVRGSFDRTPSEVRRHAHTPNSPANDGAVTLRLSYREPLDWRGLLGESTGDSIDRVLRTVDRLNRPDSSGRRRVRIHAIGFPTIFSQARFGENTGVHFAMLMRLLCERNGGAFVALNSLKP
jgi:AraC-like DNA-binding protein